MEAFLVIGKISYEDFKKVFTTYAFFIYSTGSVYHVKIYHKNMKMCIFLRQNYYFFNKSKSS
ncbi:hypothetical protein SSCHL_1501 [Staphylococcus schleiferi]|nr:hypothetical protein SSCHL_1501 [Staphylococcus schleiferi]